MIGGLLGAAVMFFWYVSSTTEQELTRHRQVLTYDQASPDTITGTPTPPGSPAPPVFVMKDGNIIYGDKPITRAEFERLLAQAKAAGHTLTFVRDSADQGGSSVQEEILGLTKTAGVPYQIK